MIKFRKGIYRFLNLTLCNFLVRTQLDTYVFGKKNCGPKNIKKTTLKICKNPTRPTVFSPASFCFVTLRYPSRDFNTNNYNKIGIIG